MSLVSQSNVTIEMSLVSQSNVTTSRTDVNSRSDHKMNILDQEDNLYDALIKGDWTRATQLVSDNHDLVKSSLTVKCDTALHVAATAEETKHSLKFVTILVSNMECAHLVLKNNRLEESGIVTTEEGNSGYTAFHIACVLGNKKMAEIMMNRYQSLRGPNDDDLRNIRASDGYFPLSASALAGKYSSVKYLYDSPQRTDAPGWTDDDRQHTLLDCVKSNFFDIAFQILYHHQGLTLDVPIILEVLAQKPEGFNMAEKNIVQPEAEGDTYALKLLKIVWEKVPNDETKRAYFKDCGFAAAKVGNTRFIAELLRDDPYLMLTKDGELRTIFHIAVIHRQRGIYNLLYEIGEYRNIICGYICNKNNNMLHLVGSSSRSSSSFMEAKTSVASLLSFMVGKKSEASLLMQRELLWFKDVYDMMPPSLREGKNADKLTPYVLFCGKNRTRVSEGLQWIKDCMVVATLIITVAFAVAFTVPGGYDQKNGLPIFIHQCDFIVFVIADAISLLFASTSLLVFLSILTSGYEQLDFLLSLPSKLLVGLLSLFISVAAMMVTFSASFFVLYHNGLKWVPILITALASLPVIVFAILQSHILVDMGRSMYDSRYLFNPKRRMLYHTRQRRPPNNPPNPPEV